MFWLQALNMLLLSIERQYSYNLFISIVCLDIKLNIDGDDRVYNNDYLRDASSVRWDLGTCTSLNSEFGSTFNYDYDFPALYTERCCLRPGRYTLACYNNPPARGWNNAYIIVDGHRYCDNFIGYRSLQKINVTRKLCAIV